MKDISVDVAMEQRSNLCTFDSMLTWWWSVIFRGWRCPDKKTKQRGHIQKTSDDYIPSFIDLNSLLSKCFFPWRYYRPGQIDFWLFQISFASAKNPSSEKSYVSGAIGVRFVRSFFSPPICYAVGRTPERSTIFIVSLSISTESGSRS